MRPETTAERERRLRNIFPCDRCQRPFEGGRLRYRRLWMADGMPIDEFLCPSCDRIDSGPRID